jgi:hypothetical protein
MNTAEPSGIQEVVSGQLPAAGVGSLPAPGGGYWWRLVKAAALVFVGVTVHLWIDGPVPAVRSEASSADTSAETVTDTLAELGDSRAVSAAGQPSLLLEPAAAEAVSSLHIQSRRAVATSGHQADPARDGGASSAELPAPKYQRIATVPAPARGLLRTGGLPEVPDAELPDLPSAPRFSGWTGGAVALSPIAVPATSAPEPRSPNATAPASGAGTPSASRVARALPVAPAREEESILQVLHEYETAVGRKDPAAAKAVWPALDDRALARAFNDLQSHSLALEDCGVTVANSNAAARARCQGVATYLPKVGRRKPISASHEWTFNLSKTGGDWQIESAAIR